MTSRAIKRILKEKIAYHKHPLDNEGIYILFDDNDMLKARVLITGPEDTPYENGFYLFDFTFTDQYPHKPPKCLYLTTQGNSRMNPNLYSNGYVCLSLLGTWSGPSWTSCNTLTSICMSLRALVLNSKPIQNEPSFEKETGERSDRYNRLLTHENLRIAVLLMMNKTPTGFGCFRERMNKIFEKNFEWYMSIVDKNKHMDGKTEKSPIWSMKVDYKYNILGKKFIGLAKKLGFYKQTLSSSTLLQTLTGPPEVINTEVTNTEVTNTEVTNTEDINTEDINTNPDNLVSITIPTVSTTSSYIIINNSINTMNDVSAALNPLPEVIKAKKKYSRKAPNGKAKNFNIGFTKLSENDGNNYEISLNKSGNKRWKKIIII